MSKRNFMLITALTLGLGWAIRGHFGHEWGASWAGAMGALALLLVAKREDWMHRTPVLAALSGIGWAVGGMMSYGIVVGYCHGNDYLNVAYGYTMLAVIGSLYGFIGGGLFGLGLESQEDKKPNWPSLLTQMIAGAWLVWGLIIYQLEWLMTPPRSELWAACAGAALALSWYLYREGYFGALRVEGYASLGAGFGFAFGNFLQVMGNTSGISYNWWNVMEFTLGFCGGLGIAYAVVSYKWPESIKPSKFSNWLALLFLLFAIPLTNFIDAFEIDEFKRMAESLQISDPLQFAQIQFLLAGMVLLFFLFLGILTWQRYQMKEANLMTQTVPILFFGYSIYYTIFGFIKKGFFYRTLSIKHSDALYVPIIILVFVLWLINYRKETKFPSGPAVEESWKRWAIIIASLLLIILIITAISIYLNQDVTRLQERF
jgi:hypothetical protein